MKRSGFSVLRANWPAALLLVPILLTGCATTPPCEEVADDRDAYADCLAADRIEAEAKKAERDRTRAIRRDWKRCADGMVEYYRRNVELGTMSRTRAQTELRLTLRQQCGEQPVGTSMPML